MKKSEKSGFYPVLINLQRFNCLVVGGGKVAYRKVVSLLNFNANITVVSPKICHNLIVLSKQNSIMLIKKKYSPEYLQDFKLVFCATDNSIINKIVRDDCTKLGLMLNVSDNPLLCDFILPANVKRGNLSVSISSQGKAPFFVKEIKKKIEKILPPVYADIVDMAGQYREKVLQNKNPGPGRIKNRLFKVFTSKDWEKILTENGTKSSKHYIKKILKEINLF